MVWRTDFKSFVMSVGYCFPNAFSGFERAKFPIVAGYEIARLNVTDWLPTIACHSYWSFWRKAVVKVGMGDDGGVEFGDVEFGKVEAGEGLFGGADVDATVKHDIGFGGLDEQAHAAHFAEAAKWRYSNVAVAEEGWAVNAAADGSEDGFAFFTRVVDGVSDFENGVGAEGRGSDDGRAPEGFESDFFHRVAGSPNDESRFFGFDDNFADGFVEGDAGDFGFFGDDFSDLFFGYIMWASYLGI